MFGFEKKKLKKKINEKASKSNVKSSKKVKKKTSVKRTIQHRQMHTKVQSAGAKKRALKIGDKYFGSPDEISAYYRAEGERVKKAMKQFKVDAAESYLGIAKGNLMKVMSQKNKLGAIAQDIESHRNVLDKKISELNSQKEKGETHKVSVKKFVNKMKFLERETKKLLDTKEQLIHREAELIQEMKTMAKLAQRDLNLTDIATADELANFEISKEAILVQAKNLLSEEMNKLFADNTILDRLDEKAVKKLGELNNQLAQIHGARKETLKKRHVLEISEKETEESLTQAEAKVKKLEEKYQALLKK